MTTRRPFAAPRPFLPAPLIAAIEAEACSPEPIDRLSRTRLSPLEIWRSPRWPLAWKWWAIGAFGDEREKKLYNQTIIKDELCDDPICWCKTTRNLIRTTPAFLKLFPRPPARLLALCRERKPTKLQVGSR